MSAAVKRIAAPLALALAAVLAAAVIRADVGFEPLRALAGLALCLVLPGAVLVACVRRRFHPLERLALSVGLSLACVIGLSAGLAAFGAELDTENWSIGLAAITVGGAVLALARGLGADAEPAAAETGAAGGRPRLASLALGALAVALVAGAGAITAASESEQVDSKPMTELWTAHPEESGSDSGSGEFVIGVRNREGEPEDYELEISVDGEPSGERTALSLSDGESDLTTQSLPARASAETPAVVDLYLAGSDEPYREVEIAPRD